MNSDVQVCAEARTNFFKQYCTVPNDLKGEVEEFCRDVSALAENSVDAAAFEAEFVNCGLSDRFNSLVTRCPPKPYEMTAEDKAHVREVKKQMWNESKGQILRDAAEDVADSVMMKVESEVTQQRRKAMIEDGVYDDYTRASNVAEDVGILSRAIGKLFKGKK